jgi:hypothetical protein
MSRIKEKVSQLVSGQLPEFIRENYSTFTTFVEAYYKFLEQDSGALELVQNARSYNDIDLTTSDFVQYFLSTYIKDIPINALANKRMLVKKISDLYTAKGSDLSFKLLFRIMYDSDVTVSHPYDYVLRPSDGTWEQRVSLRVSLSSGSVTNILDRYLTYKKDGITYNEPIIRVKTLTNNIYEVFLKSSSTAPYTLGDTVTVSDGTSNIFVGIIKPTTTGYVIKYSGTGFKVGQIFEVTAGGGINTLVRIVRVNSNGGVTLLKLLNYGYGFSGDISINLFTDLRTINQSETLNTSSSGFLEQFLMMSPDISSNASRYFDSDYVAIGYTGTTLSRSTNSQLNSNSDSFSSSVNDTSVAVINFTMGAVAKYPGQYITSKGFLSEPEVRLQNVNLYQPFAYELQSELDISYFYDTVLKLIHPAGTKLFNNRTITATANISANVSVLTRSNVAIQLQDSFKVLDTALIGLNKDFGYETANTSDIVTLTVKPVFTDNATTSDSAIISLYLSAFTDNTTPTESLTINTSLAAFTDNTAPSDTITLNTGKNIPTTDSTVTLTETISGNLFNYTTDASPVTGYFANIYVASTVITA